MKAEDTVMGVTAVKELFGGSWDTAKRLSIGTALAISNKAQAEISFKAGVEQEHKVMIGVAVDEGNKAYKVGQRIVVESLGLHENEMGFCEISNHVPYTQLKEWGIKNESKRC